MEITETIKEGFIADRATGKIVDFRKPEEIVRQSYEKELFEDYDYKYEQMDIEVSIQRGEKNSLKNKSERADIVVYTTVDKTKRDPHRDIIGIVELKRPTRKEGVKQLMSYMSATSCLWGVWTNGEEIEYLYRDPKSGEIRRDYVFQIPKNGERFEDIGRIAKDKLPPKMAGRNRIRKILFLRKNKLIKTSKTINAIETVSFMSFLIRFAFPTATAAAP